MKATEVLRLTLLAVLLLLSACGDGQDDGGSRAEPGYGAALPDPEDEDAIDERNADRPRTQADEALDRAMQALMVPMPAPGDIGIRLPDIGPSPGVLDPALSGRYRITEALLAKYVVIASEMKAAAASGRSMQKVLDRHGWPVMKYAYVTGRVQRAAMMAASGSGDSAGAIADVEARIEELEGRLEEDPQARAMVGAELNMLRMKLAALKSVRGPQTTESAESRRESELIKRWLARMRERATPR